MALKTLATNGMGLALDELALFIWGNEILFGQATQIGHDSMHTVVVFDNSKHVPVQVGEEIRVVVVAGEEDAPATAVAFLCQGKAFVGGVLGHVKVFRV
jgi:hypothetical protein